MVEKGSARSLGGDGLEHVPAYLEEHHETVLTALEHATDLMGQDSWETTFWVRSRVDARTLQALLRRSVFDVTGRMEQPVLACVGLVRMRRPSEADPARYGDTWGVFVTVRPA